MITKFGLRRLKLVVPIHWRLSFPSIPIGVAFNIFAYAFACLLYTLLVALYALWLHDAVVIAIKVKAKKNFLMCMF